MDITTSKVIGWGILGTASIARRQAVPALLDSEHGVIQAVGSRDLERAQQFADEFNIPLAFDSYDRLIQSDEVDAVYIALPNDMHLPWIKKAASHGKHVLCEKPIGLHEGEVAEVIQSAREHGVQVMEGVATYFHPMHRRVVELIRNGAIGQLLFIRISLGWSFRDKPGDYRWKQEHGGGALLDLGCYPISTARQLSGEEPITVSARATAGLGDAGDWFHPAHHQPSTLPYALSGAGVDTNVAITLTFPTVTALIDVGIMSGARNYYEAIGTDGKIVVDQAYGNRVMERTIRLFDHTGAQTDSEAFNAHQIAIQFDTVTTALRRGEAMPISLEESLQNARVIDACFASAKLGGRPVDL